MLKKPSETVKEQSYKNFAVLLSDIEHWKWAQYKVMYIIIIILQLKA